MNETNDELNKYFVRKVKEYMGFSDIIQYPFIFVEVDIWE